MIVIIIATIIIKNRLGMKVVEKKINPHQNTQESRAKKSGNVIKSKAKRDKKSG